MLYELILPLRIPGTLTYGAGEFSGSELQPGTRVLVPFRKNKVVTGIIYRESTKNPVGFNPKSILAVADDEPFVNENLLKLWEWIAGYYLCTLGEVMAAAIPGVLRPNGDMLLKRMKSDEELTDVDDYLNDLFFNQESQSIESIYQYLNRKNLPAQMLYNWLQNHQLQWDDSNIRWGDYYTRKALFLKPELEQNEEKLGKLLDSLDKKSPKQAETLMLFLGQYYSGVPLYRDELKRHEGFQATALQSLITKGILISESAQTQKHQLGRAEFSEIMLSEAQQTAFDALKAGLEQSDISLLQGITGSGKTEIYLKLSQKLIAQNKQVLFLMPEIALTAQMIQRVQKALGPCVAVFHSDTSDKEKTELWEQIKSGQAKMILGARSAIFAPYHQLGLIIVDEEHEAAYKQKDPAPRYHGRDTAIVLAKNFNAAVVLGSATPSVESRFNAETGKYRLVKLERRFNNIPLPEIQVVDMRESMRKREARAGFSLELATAVSAQLEQRRQSIIFRNRKGYAPHVQCRQCGWLARCRNCDISLSYFKLRNILKCHLCGYTTAAVTECPACHADSLMIKGTGTERIEESIETLFPEMKSVRLDSETSSSRIRRQQIISDFERGLTDVMIGTQILAKGFDFKGVGLVGILEADGIWSFPDFRANERAFQLMIQVAGRAGRAGQQGLVFVQTFNPQYPLLRFLTAHDYEGFYHTECEQRRLTGYPPFLRLIHIALRHANRNLCHDAAEALRADILPIIPNISEVIVPGIERMNNRFHRELLIKLPRNQNLNRTKAMLLRTLQNFHTQKRYAAINVIVDVDPYF